MSLLTVGQPAIGVTKPNAGSLTSNNFSASEGSKIDLKNGEFLFGGTDNPVLSLLSDIFSARGEIRVIDIVDPADGVTITQYSYFATGTAAYDTATETVTGTGIIIGSPGIFWVVGGEVLFAIAIDSQQVLITGSSVALGDESGGFSTLNNATQLAYDAQRTADIAVMNGLDVNRIVESLLRASSITLTPTGAETGGGTYTFDITI